MRWFVKLMMAVLFIACGVRLEANSSLYQYFDAAPGNGVNPVQIFTVSLNVQNLGPNPVSQVQCSVASMNGAAKGYWLSGPIPSSWTSLSSNAIASFTYTYSASGCGTLLFSAYALATDVSTSASVTAGPQNSTPFTVNCPSPTFTSTPILSPTLSSTQAPPSSTPSATPTAPTSTITQTPTLIPTSGSQNTSTATPTTITTFIYVTATPAPTQGTAVIPRNVYKVNQDPPLNLNYFVPNDGTVTIKIYSRTGRVLATIIKQVSAGNHSVSWDGHSDLGDDVPTGIYMVRFQGPGLNKMLKMAIIR